jgi:hypothetical protein
MEALSALTIGNNVQRARVGGAQERLVAAIATAQAGCTPGIRGWALGIRESLRLSIRWWPVRNQTPEVDLYFSDYGVNRDFEEFDPHTHASRLPRPRESGVSRREVKARVISGRRSGSQRSMLRGLPGPRAKRRSRRLVLCHPWC